MGDRRSRNGPVREKIASKGTGGRIRRSWPVMAVVAGVGGLLAWLGWQSTRPDMPDQEQDRA